jgi:hypothetical protein
MGNYSDEKVQLASKLNSNFEGFTMNTELRKPKTLRYNERYIVGGFSEEEVLDFSPANIRGQFIFNYIEKNWDKAKEDNLFFGIWYNKETKKMHLDLCRAFGNREKAGREARLKNEICFWDNLENEEIH